MPSSNKTDNYGLNQWLGTDNMMYGDWNSDNSKIDAEFKNINDKLGDAVKTDGTLQTGLNAEMVGGKHSTDFVSAYGSFNQDTTDINTYNPNKTWTARVGSNNINRPTGISDYSTVLNVGSNNNSNFQIAGAYDNSNKLGYRCRHDSDGAYGSWKRILNEDDYNTLFQYASNGKSAIASAITGKGVTATSDMTFTQLASAVSNIKAKTTSGTSNTSSSGGSTISIGVGYKPTLVYYTYDTYQNGNYVSSFSGVYTDVGFTNAIGFDLNKIPSPSFGTISISDVGFTFSYNNTSNGSYGAILRNWKVVHMEY
jgi:hypothetical protein